MYFKWSSPHQFWTKLDAEWSKRMIEETLSMLENAPMPRVELGFQRC
jgi:uncharacterized protein with NAD-binding domain and iron-sulfur cluster